MSTPGTPPSSENPPSGEYSAPPPPPAEGGYAAPPPQPAYGQPVPAPVAGAPVTESDERTWATLGHIGGAVLAFVSGGVLQWIAGLVVFLIYKDRSPFLRQQSVEALNFQITTAIAGALSYVLWTVAIGFVLTPAVIIVQVIFGILAGLAANKHENYRYPFAIRIIK